MRSYNFTLVAAGLDPNDGATVDKLYESGLDDASLSFQRGLMLIEVDREAKSFLKALVSAIMDARKAGARIVRVEPDHLVTASDIADRCNRGRASVSLYIKGERGRGRFPSPVARVETESPLYDWADVAAWLSRNNVLAVDEVISARLIKSANTLISAAQVDRHAARIVATLMNEKQTRIRSASNSPAEVSVPTKSSGTEIRPANNVVAFATTAQDVSYAA